MVAKLEFLREKLSLYGQEHLLDFAEALSGFELNQLVEQIESIDFELVSNLYKASIKEHSQHARGIFPIPCDKLNDYETDRVLDFNRIGSDIIKSGKAAALTMAGGQGTRLGHPGPKGTFFLPQPINKSIFQLQAEKLKLLSEEHQRWIPWYIMTSEENHIDTVDFFKENDYFGYSRREIFFFKQGELPMLSLDGKILLKEKNKIYFGPDGNGGVFSSLAKSGALKDMDSRGVEWVFFTGIDNVLVKMVDPVFIGYAESSGKHAASKSSAKRDPEERAGVFCIEEGKATIVEYSEMPEEYIRLTDNQGHLLYGDINILVHLYKIDVLHEIANQGLPYHKAVKKAEHIDKNGSKVEPLEPNALKYESFIFDSFKLLDGIAILRVERDEEFAPVKNRTGEDSPETAIRLLERRKEV